MKPTLLIIDDEPRLRRALSRGLRRHFIVVEAEGVQSGLQAVRDHKPSVILCDMLMPDGSGVDFHRGVGASYKRRVLFQSGGAPDWMREYLNREGSLLLDKPAFLQDILSACQALQAL